jgi:hypothetical protein
LKWKLPLADLNVAAVDVVDYSAVEVTFGGMEAAVVVVLLLVVQLVALWPLRFRSFCLLALTANLLILG